MSASCLALRRLTHRSPRTFQSRISSVSRISSAASSFSSLNALRAVNSTAPRVSRFSTMAPLQSGSQDGALQKPYDPEIQDMANYIHNYEVNSDLAVRILNFCLFRMHILRNFSPKAYDIISLTISPMTFWIPV